MKTAIATATLTVSKKNYPFGQAPRVYCGG